MLGLLCVRLCIRKFLFCEKLLSFVSVNHGILPDIGWMLACRP